MMNIKFFLIFVSGLFAFFTVGVINKSYEYYEPEICLKYPSMQLIFNKPDLPDNYVKEDLSPGLRKKLDNYEHVQNLSENLGGAGKFIALIIIQFFLSFLCMQFFKGYNRRHFFADIIFFLVSAFVLFIFLKLFLRTEIVLIIVVLIFNILLNYLLRNVAFKRMDRIGE